MPEPISEILSGLQSGVLAHSEVAVGFDPSVEWAVEPS